MAFPQGSALVPAHREGTHGAPARWTPQCSPTPGHRESRGKAWGWGRGPALPRVPSQFPPSPHRVFPASLSEPKRPILPHSTGRGGDMPQVTQSPSSHSPRSGRFPPLPQSHRTHRLDGGSGSARVTDWESEGALISVSCCPSGGLFPWVLSHPLP